MQTHENPPNVTKEPQPLPGANTQALSPPPALANRVVLMPSPATCSASLLPAPPTANHPGLTLGLDPSQDVLDSLTGWGMES